MNATIQGRSWGPEVYEQMRDILSGKGFEPEDPATAAALGYPGSMVHNEPTVDFYALGKCFPLTATHPDMFLVSDVRVSNQLRC
jgi:hypothetical protein